MPIELRHSITPLSEQDFHHLDYAVMSYAFEIHNKWGRLYDESIYQEKLKQCCINHGFDVEEEFPITLTHQSFSKTLFIDLLISNGVYELKTIQSIASPQKSQTFDYLFLTGSKHGKIINLRPPSVEHEFVSTTLNHESRRSFSIEDTQWKEYSKKASLLKETVLNLFKDWGLYLRTELYKEALVHLLGGEENILQPLTIHDGTHFIGKQKFACLSEEECFVLSASKHETSNLRTHLARLLNYSPLKLLYWINLKHSTVQLSTLEKNHSA